jgi:hypothetical protein
MDPDVQPPAATDERCGTYAGYQQHGMAKQPPCEPCLKANRAYHRRYEDARRRALTKLAHAYPARFRRILAEERAKVSAGGVR